MVDVQPYKRVQGRCPICGKECSGYDQKRTEPSHWRGPNLNGFSVFLRYAPKRVECEEHGVQTEQLPWTDGNTRSLAAFNDEVTYLTLHMPRSAVSEYMNVNWRTVGNCIEATHDRLEPDVKERLRGVKRFCVDETSYKKGHKYVTIVVDMDKNRVVWAHKDHGLEVFKLFCEELSPEQRAQITLIAGDGAKWIDGCMDYFPNAVRCVDPFHVVGWVNEALDEVRTLLSSRAVKQFNKEKKEMEEAAEAQRQAWLKEYRKYKDAVVQLEQLKHRRGKRSNATKELMEFVQHFEDEYGETMDILAKAKKGQLTEEQKARLAELEKKAKNHKGCKYALGMNPENLSDYNVERLEMIRVSDPELYEAYKLKEQIRVIIHMTDRELAAKELDAWIEAAKASGFEAFVKLADKIKRHRENILNSIEYGGNSAKSEQINGLINGLIRIAHGFRNLDNMFALIYLRCSDLVVPLANRYRPTYEDLQRKRERARNNRQKRQAQKEAKATA